MNIDKNFIIEFIRLYRSLPALWDPSASDYTDRVVRNDQWGLLLEKYRQKFPSAGKEDVKKKICSLRVNFIQELRKYEAGEEKVPSKWKFYEELEFLKRVLRKKSPKAAKAKKSKPAYDLFYKNGPTIDEGNENLMLDRGDSAVSPKTNPQTSLLPPSKKINADNDFEEPLDPSKKRHQHHPDEFYSIAKPAYEFLHNGGPSISEGNENLTLDCDEPAVLTKTNTLISSPLEQIKVEEDIEEPVEAPSKRYQYHPDEFDSIAAVWAAELRKMEPSQQIFAKKAVNDILFEGRMERLHQDSVFIIRNNN